MKKLLIIFGLFVLLHGNIIPAESELIFSAGIMSSLSARVNSISARMMRAPGFALTSLLFTSVGAYCYWRALEIIKKVQAGKAAWHDKVGHYLMTMKEAAIIGNVGGVIAITIGVVYGGLWINEFTWKYRPWMFLNDDYLRFECGSYETKLCKWSDILEMKEGSDQGEHYVEMRMENDTKLRIYLSENGAESLIRRYTSFTKNKNTTSLT